MCMFIDNAGRTVLLAIVITCLLAMFHYCSAISLLLPKPLFQSPPPLSITARPHHPPLLLSNYILYCLFGQCLSLEKTVYGLNFICCICVSFARQRIKKLLFLYFVKLISEFFALHL